MGVQKSAEGIVGGGSTPLKARTQVTEPKPGPSCQREAQKMSLNSHATPEGRGRNPREQGAVRQADTAEKDVFDSEAQGFTNTAVGWKLR